MSSLCSPAPRNMSTSTVCWAAAEGGAPTRPLHMLAGAGARFVCSHALQFAQPTSACDRRAAQNCVRSTKRLVDGWMTCTPAMMPPPRLPSHL